MLKIAIDNYMSEINKDNIKRFGSRGMVLCTYLLLLIPVLWLEKSSNEELVRYFITAIPLLVSMLLLSIHDNAIPKMMHLCPISRSEKREYLILHYLVNITIAFAVFVIPLLVALILGFINVINFGIILVLIVMMVLSASFNLGSITGIKRVFPKELDTITITEGFAFMISLIEIVVIPLMLLDNQIEKMGVYIIVGIFLIIGIFPVYKLMSKFGQIMDYYVDYENTIIIEDKARKSH